MKLSFSTKGWHNASFEDFCHIASDLGFEGIELHNIHNRLFTDRDGAFHDYAAAATRRNLFEKKLSLPCLDAVCDLSGESDGTDEATVEEIRACLSIAGEMHIPNVRIRAAEAEDKEKAVKHVVSVIEKVLPMAEEKHVSLLLETGGIFSHTAELRTLLDSFASDYLGALWQMSAAYFGGGESPEEVIRNLGAYVRHVHVCDARKTEKGIEYCLVGEGELPLRDMMLALRSVNYDGFLSLVWDPAWCEELDDMEIIYAQYAGFMKQFSDTSRNEKTLYYNRAHTGKFVWKKDLLIDETFPRVLDRMVEEFPDQYAFKYTTLDYTRTYSEFRDDVDTFARLGIQCASVVHCLLGNGQDRCSTCHRQHRL